MPVDRNTRKVKGYAVVTFLVPENAARAFMELDGSILHGRMLHLLPGKAKQSLEELMEKGNLKEVFIPVVLFVNNLFMNT
jgi:multiple RNA-binding domain-containing protein 1